jgi:polyisoprenoid-binding protein YceI
MPLDISVTNRSFVRAWVLALAAGACLAGAPAFAADYVQAPGSSLIFASRYQGEVFTGQFAKFSTRLSFDPQQLADARLDVVIALASASSANDDRDAALQSADFFDTAKFPQAHYRASKFRHLGGNRNSQPVTLTFTWTPGAQPLLSGKATVQRLDFGVGAGDWADLELIPNGVAISTKVLLTPAK